MGGILAGPVDDTLAAPVGEIVQGRGETLVVQHTVFVAALLVVGAEHIEPVAEDVGFSVGHIGVQRQIGIESLFFLRSVHRIVSS